MFVGFQEPGALFGGVGEFGVGVGELDAAEVELPAFGAGGVAGLAAGEGGEGGGVVDEDDGMVGGQGGLDAGDEVEVEAVGVELQRRIPAGMLDEGLRNGLFFPQFLREGNGLALPGEIDAAAQFRGDEGQQRLGVGEDFEIARVGAVPFEQGEFGVVPAPVFAVARDGAELEDVSIAGGEQALHVQLGGGAQPAGAGGDGVDVRLGRVGGQQDGGVDFEEPAFAEEAAEAIVQPGAQLEDAAPVAQGVGIRGTGAHGAARVRTA